MKRKFAMLVLVSALAAPLAVQAADSTGGQGRPSVDQVMQKMTEKLNLTPDQQPKVRAVVEARRKKEDALRDEAKTINDKSNKDILAVLTPDQQKTFNDMMAKHRSGSGRHTHGGAPTTPK